MDDKLFKALDKLYLHDHNFDIAYAGESDPMADRLHQKGYLEWNECPMTGIQVAGITSAGLLAYNLERKKRAKKDWGNSQPEKSRPSGLGCDPHPREIPRL